MLHASLQCLISQALECLPCPLSVLIQYVSPPTEEILLGQ